MKSKRLTNKLCDEIVWEVINNVNKTFDKENKLDELREGVFDKVYEILYTPYICHMPDDAIYMNYEICFKNSKGKDCYVRAKKEKPMFLYCRTPKIHVGSIEATYDKILVLEQLGRVRTKEVVNKLYDVLSKAKSTKQVLELYPEIKTLCPSVFGD